MSKQYGLILPQKGHVVTAPIATHSIFGDDSDSDGAHARPTGLSKALKRQDRLLQERAVEEDPTVYQYDELYDDMQQKRHESKLARKDLDRQPKYISKLLQSADRRKRENERRIERQVQKEREAEGEQYRDKESFVTSAYRRKLEEFEEMEAAERREEYLETIGDVRKQGNLDGFYRHLYDQKVLQGEKGEGRSDEGDKDVEEEPQKKLQAPKRTYRQRECSHSDEEEMADEPEKKVHLPSHLDADSDFSIDSSDEEEVEKEKTEVKIKVEAPDTVDKVVEEEKTEVNSEEVKEEETKVEETKIVKPKVDIWKKRTIGTSFDEALKRYFERKAMREEGTYVRPSL